MRVIEKPWGKEELLEVNDRYVVKKLTMFSGKRCSLQYHKEKHESILVLSGKMNLYIGSSEKDLTLKRLLPGAFIVITPGMIHRMEAEDHLEYLEVSTPELEDVVRLQDDYKRISP